MLPLLALAALAVAPEPGGPVDPTPVPVEIVQQGDDAAFTEATATSFTYFVETTLPWAHGLPGGPSNQAAMDLAPAGVTYFVETTLPWAHGLPGGPSNQAAMDLAPPVSPTSSRPPCRGHTAYQADRRTKQQSTSRPPVSPTSSRPPCRGHTAYQADRRTKREWSQGQGLGRTKEHEPCEPPRVS